MYVINKLMIHTIKNYSPLSTSRSSSVSLQDVGNHPLLLTYLYFVALNNDSLITMSSCSTFCHLLVGQVNFCFPICFQYVRFPSPLSLWFVLNITAASCVNFLFYIRKLLLHSSILFFFICSVLFVINI